MATSRTSRRHYCRPPAASVGKPRGLLHPCALATQWAAQGKDPRHTRVTVALRFCRIAVQM
jgi:hypothetical protein